MRFNTDLLHAGVVREANGATLPPVYQSSAFEQDTAADLEKIFENKAPGYCYTRVGNPTVTAFENRITKLEGGMASIACASGMAAIMNAILNIVRSGDEIVSSASLYGGSIDLFRDIEEFGIKTRYVKNNDWEAIEGAINEHTRLLFAETIGNPCLDVTDVERLAEIAHVHKIPLILDNTTATAYLFQGLKHGADIVVNSSSKYINGSSNSISGILTYSGRFQWDPEMYPQIAAYKKFGPMAYIARLRNSLFRDTGACLAPMNAYLNLIGMETLGLRMERQCSNALELAQWLEETYPSVTVNYPGLKSSNWYEISEKQFSRGYGAILTLRVGSKENAFALIDALKIPYTLSNIGDTKTLVIHPGSTISLHSSEQEKEEAASSTAVQEKQTYTAKETTPWSNESQSGTTTVVDKVSYQIGENTITLHHTYTDTWTNYAEPGIQHTQKINATNTYTLSQPLQGIERQGQWVVIWDVPAGTVVSLSGIETDAWDGETDGSWNQDGLSGWLKTSRVLTPDEVYEWGYGTDYGCTEGWGDTLTVEKGKLYELIDVNEGGYFPTDGGFVFRGV